MGLSNSKSGVTFVNISNGKLFIKPKGGDRVYFDNLSGTLTGVKFEKKEYEGKEYEVAVFDMTDGIDNFVLTVRVESGYFRGMVNALKSGDPLKPIKLAPTFKDDKAGMFVEQHGKWLKHFHTKDNPGDLPQMKLIKFRGKDTWDGTEQTEYFKNWLKSIKWTHEAVAETTPMETENELAPPPSIGDDDLGLPF